jgi:hypothetical protein
MQRAMLPNSSSILYNHNSLYARHKDLFMFNIKQARLDLREGQFIENDGYGSVWSLKKAQPSSRSLVGIHTILQVNTV